jgi:hypothetical protein
LIHPFLFFQATRDQQTRKIEAHDAVSRDWMSANRVVTIPENYASAYLQRTREIAATQSYHSLVNWGVTWISSVIIIALSICALRDSKKNAP